MRPAYCAVWDGYTAPAVGKQSTNSASLSASPLIGYEGKPCRTPLTTSALETFLRNEGLVRNDGKAETKLVQLQMYADDVSLASPQHRIV